MIYLILASIVTLVILYRRYFPVRRSGDRHRSARRQERFFSRQPGGHWQHRIFQRE